MMTKTAYYMPVSYTHLWDRKYHEQENSEICEMVHAQSLTPEQLAVIIQMAQAAVPNPENLKLDEKETEDME